MKILLLLVFLLLSITAYAESGGDDGWTFGPTFERIIDINPQAVLTCMKALQYASLNIKNPNSDPLFYLENKSGWIVFSGNKIYQVNRDRTIDPGKYCANVNLEQSKISKEEVFYQGFCPDHTCISSLEWRKPSDCTESGIISVSPTTDSKAYGAAITSLSSLIAVSMKLSPESTRVYMKRGDCKKASRDQAYQRFLSSFPSKQDSESRKISHGAAN